MLLLRLIILATILGTTWIAYTFAQGTLARHAGFDIRIAGLSIMFSAVLLGVLGLPFITVAWLARDATRLRRWSEGRCPACDHPRHPDTFDPQQAYRCPECGAELRFPDESPRRAPPLVLPLVMFLLGCLAAELWLRMDEAVFESQATAPQPAERIGVRARWWPNHEVSLYLDADGSIITSR